MCWARLRAAAASKGAAGCSKAIASAAHHSSAGWHHTRQVATHSLQVWAILSRPPPECEDGLAASITVDSGMPGLGLLQNAQLYLTGTAVPLPS